MAGRVVRGVCGAAGVAPRARRRLERATPSPRAGRRTRIALLVLLSLAAMATLSAQAQPDRDLPATALLELGPESRRGIDALAPDATPHWYVRYRVAQTLVDVRYVREPLSKPRAWPTSDCRLRTLRSADGELFYYEARDWSMIVAVASGELPPGVTLCSFVDRFIERHLLFQNLEAVKVPGSAPLFPAVIEL